MRCHCIAAGLAALAGPACAGQYDQAIEAFTQAYEAGTLWPERADYRALYAGSSARHVLLRQVRELPERRLAAAEFETVVVKTDGTEDRRAGGIVFHLSADEPRTVEAIEFAEGRVGVGATSGQVADLATTLAGVAGGVAAEANPVIAPLTASPAGWVALGALKVGLGRLPETLDYADCVEASGRIGGFGWGAAAWNLGAVLVNPVAGIVAAVYAYARGSAAARENAAIACLPKAPETEATAATTPGLIASL